MLNNGTGESNILQNQFTAYLCIAIHRTKVNYLRIIRRQQLYELSIELQDYSEHLMDEPDLTKSLPLLENLENRWLYNALVNAKQRELYIFLARALEDRSFSEIADELCIGYKTVSSIYYRMIEKIKKELGGGNE